MPDVFINCYIDSFVLFSHKVLVGKIASYPAKQTMHVNLRPFYEKKIASKRLCDLPSMLHDQWFKWIFTKTCLGKSPGSS